MSEPLPLRVLILEDNPADAELLLDKLRQAGFEPNYQLVASERDYSAKLSASLDLILADFSLPHFDAPGALDLLQQRRWDIPFIIVSGTIGEEQAVALMKQGASDYLLKDRLGRFGTAVTQALEAKRLRDVQRQSETALRASETRFRALIEKSSEAILMVGADGIVIYDSPSVERLTGYLPSERPERRLLEQVYPADSSHVSDLFAQLIQQPGETVVIQLRIWHRDGSLHWIEGVATNLLDEPSVGAIVINYRDVSERKRADDELAHYREHLEQLVEQRTVELERARQRVEAILNNTTDGIALAYPHQGIEQSNSMFNTLFVCEPGRYSNQSLLMLVCAEDRDRLATLIEAVTADGVGRQDEFRALRADNTLFEARIGLGYVEGGDVMGAGLVFSIQDISELKERERLLRYHASLQENVTDAVIATDLDFRIQSWNRAAEQIYGWCAEEVLGKLIGEVLRTEFASDESGEQVQQDFMEKGSWSHEVVQQHKDGHKLQILSSTVLFKDESGQPFGLVAVNHDITVRIKAENELRQALAKEKELNELKTGFVSMVSHDFRSPLASIQSSSDLLQNYSDRMTMEKKQQHFTTITGQIKHLTGLLEDMLTVTQADSVGLPFHPVLTDLSVFCQTVADEMQALAGNHHIRFTINRPGEAVRIDPALLRRALVNLLSNAVKYSPDGGVAEFSVVIGDESLEIGVKDQGIGIPEPDQVRLFEVFHRAQNVGVIPGTGLGLAIVKRVVDAHGGTITVQSEVGIGSSFTLSLPLLEAEAATK